MIISVGPVRLPADRGPISVGDSNPGLGGTEFMAIVLAKRMAELAPVHDVVLWVSEGSVSLLSPPKNLQIRTSLVGVASDVLISPAYEIHSNTADVVAVSAKRRVAWSHHPHDPYLSVKSLRSADAVVFVGHYARLSNRSRLPNSLPSFKIRNPFVPHFDWNFAINLAEHRSHFPTGISSSSKIIGYVGALHPAKGFHHVARMWSRISNRVKGAQLVVVGSASLYGDSDEHARIPTSHEYAMKIISAFGSSTPPDNVQFVGRRDSGIDDIIRTFDLAIANPTGLSEADPATIKNYFRLGIPVVGGLGFGQTELLAGLPGPALHDIADLPFVIGELFDHPEKLASRAAAGLSRAAALALSSAHELPLWIQIAETSDLRELASRMATVPATDDWTGLASLRLESGIPSRRNAVAKWIRERTSVIRK